MKLLRKITSILPFLLFCLPVSGQVPDSTVNRLTQYIRMLNNFSRHIPQEKVYLHFDNTSYYQGDHIWFKCYVVSSEQLQISQLSKTLYVELLNPGGDIIEKKILQLENGQCHGEFTLSQLPFYSGFYEIRAYTKYMLNFGEDAIFSRMLPVFDKPKEEGNFEEKNMLKYGYGKYPVKRKKPEKGKKVNLTLFPEGGYLVNGLTSQVAFEATDAFGNPIDIYGAIVDEDKVESTRFASMHDGRGVFTFTPTEKKQMAVVDYNGKKFQFDMPEAQSQGFVLSVDNLSGKDSLGVTVQKSRNTTDNMLGMAIICGGKLQHFSLFRIDDEEPAHININKAKISPGVSRLLLYDSNGRIISDRLFFTNRNESLRIEAHADKKDYAPYEPVEMEFLLTDKENNPVQTPFSVSVRDDRNEVESDHDILTDLLLMSEIKGYVRTPSYYFESDDPGRRTALDHLLMVQGWRRYSWEQMTGIAPFDLKYLPEQGIEIHGDVVSFVKKVPKANVDVSLFLTNRGEEEDKASFLDSFVTDSMGRFSFVTNLTGKWDMILSVAEKGKKKDYRIILDRVFTPSPQKYRYADMQVSLADTKAEIISEEETLQEPDSTEENYNAFMAAYEDSLAKAGIDEKVHRLDEVKITAKKRSKERDIYESKLKSLAFYDVQSEWDDIKDRGEFIGKDIHELMINMNKNFWRMYSLGDEYLRYKGRMPLFVINYERTMATEMDYNKYKIIRLEAIKSIYISEDLSTMLRYADPKISPLEIDKLYSCVVLVETYPEGQIPTDVAKGVRKTWLEGYSPVKEFYSPDYSVLPPETDYRRTLYWNPSVVTDEEGKAKIRFYNNSRCRKFRISAETVTPMGKIGRYKE